MFSTLGLLVFPSQLGHVAGEGLLLAGVLMLIARPAAALIATQFSHFHLRERLLLGWAGLRGAVPIVFATFPVIDGLPQGNLFFNIAFFVVVTSTLIQGATFQPIARMFGLTREQPALPRPVAEVGTIRRLGAELIEYPVASVDAIAGARIRELGLPRQALVKLGLHVTEMERNRAETFCCGAGGGRMWLEETVGQRINQNRVDEAAEALGGRDMLHILVRREVRREVEDLFSRWRGDQGL